MAKKKDFDELMSIGISFLTAHGIMLLRRVG